MIDSQAEFCQTPAMSQTTRKFIAVLLALWLPLFSGSALAATISMQYGSCHETGMGVMQMADIHHHDDHQHGVQNKQPCNNCGICHLAYSGYLGVQEVNVLDSLHLAFSVTPYLLSFHSISSIPLLPPPLDLA
jgi:hypothetical protein